MNTWVRRSLKAGALTAGAVMATGTAAYADTTLISADNTGILNGTQVFAPIQAPINLCGVSAAVLGTASAGCEGGSAADLDGLYDVRMISAGNTGLLNGTQIFAPIQAPINICGVAASLLGTADAGCKGGASATHRTPSKHDKNCKQGCGDMHLYGESQPTAEALPIVGGLTRNLPLVDSLPVVGGLTKGDLPVVGGLTKGDLPVVGNLTKGGGLPLVGSLTQGGGLPVVGGLTQGLTQGGGLPVVGGLTQGLTQGGGLPVVGSLTQGLTQGDGLPIVGSLTKGGLGSNLPLVGPLLSGLLGGGSVNTVNIEDLDSVSTLPRTESEGEPSTGGGTPGCGTTCPPPATPPAPPADQPCHPEHGHKPKHSVKMVSAGNVGIGNGTQIYAPIQLPIDVSGVAVGVLGKATSWSLGGSSAGM